MRHRNGEIWYDDQGKKIQAHGGCVIKHGDTWYWYGENKEAKNLPGTTRVDVIGISCYSSKNLTNWHYEGLALKTGDDSNSLMRPECVCERPKVLYNKKTDRFVMWVHLDDAQYLAAKVGVAVSKTPQGPFTIVREMQPNRQDSRDMTLYQEGEKAWLLHSSNWNKTMHIAELADDYTDVTGVYTSALIEQEREAPAVMKYGNTYYMVTSGCTGWEPNSALYATAAYVMGHWKLIDNPCQGPAYRRTFEGQSTWIFEADGQYYLMLDHWKPEELRNSGYSFLPILFQDGTMTIKWTEFFERK